MKRRRKRGQSGVSGEQLRELRKRAGIAGSELAREMKCSHSHLCQVEKCYRPLSHELLKRAKGAAVRIAEKRLTKARKYVERLEEIEAHKDQLEMEALWARGGQERLLGNGSDE
jgi:transcriptional regulator with XRE-family HTH domain